MAALVRNAPRRVVGRRPNGDSATSLGSYFSRIDTTEKFPMEEFVGLVKLAKNAG